MKRIKKYLKELYNKYLISFKRFPICNIAIILLGIILITTIICEFSEKIYISLTLPLILTLFFSLYISLLNKNILFNSIISLFTTVISFLFLYNSIDNLYFYLAYCGLLIISILLIINLLSKNVYGNILAYFISKLAFCGIISLIILIGLMICASCFNLLIYSFEDYEKIYLIIFVVCQVVIFPLLFIIFIPNNGEKLKLSKLYSLLLNRVSLTLYYLLIILLYIYLIKIIITFTLPVGVINWFASFSLLFYIYFVLSNDDKYFLNIFNIKYGCYLLIPIFIIQHISIFIRINAYGLTTLRVLSLVFNLISLIFIILVIFNKLNYFYIVSCIIVFIFTVIPYTNAIDVSAFEQQYRLKNLLIKNNMFINNEIIKKESISSDDKSAIFSSYVYLVDSYSNKVSLIKKDSDFENTFGFKYFDYYSPDRYCNYFYDIRNVKIANYQYFDVITHEYFINKDKLKEYCLDVYNLYGPYNDNVVLEYVEKDNEKFYFAYLSFEIDNDNCIVDESISLSGYRLY